MNNREWLNTLSDEEYNEFVDIDSSIICSDKRCSEYADKDICGNETTNCTSCQLAWLSQPHETSADEDFAEIGFKPVKSEGNCFTYVRTESRIDINDIVYRTLKISIDKNSNAYTTANILGGNGEWTDKLIDAVRPIADKKRKEVWNV